jgi:4-hydroxybenzoate decarboxylase
MRDYMAKIKEAGQLRVVQRTVDPYLELARVVEASQARDADVILFENVRGSPFAVVSNIYGDEARFAGLLGVAPENFGQGWMDAMHRFENLSHEVFEPVSAAPDLCEYKLDDLPRIHWREKDGGAYISAGVFYARDPLTGVGNLSFCRALMREDRLVCCLVPFHDLARYRQNAEAAGGELEVAILIGPPPEIFLAACASLPIDMDEMALAAAIRRAPIPMRPCLSIDLQVPSETEIVLEGRIRKGVEETEGPYGEFMGYYGAVNEQGAVVDVLTVSARPGAVFHGLLCGSPEDLVPLNRTFAMRPWYALKTQMPEAVLEILANPVFFSLIVRIRKTGDAQPERVIDLVFETAARWTSLCIVVDEDVQIADMAAVMHAYLTRGRVDTRIKVFPAAQGHFGRLGGRVGIDATTPMADRVHTQSTKQREPLPDIDSYL